MFYKGNDKLHKLTAQDEYELLITMQDFGNQKRYARYSNFKVGNEANKFNMTYSKFTGDVGELSNLFVCFKILLVVMLF